MFKGSLQRYLSYSQLSLQEFNRLNSGSIDEDPGWEGLQDWVKPKVARDTVRKWLADKREALAQPQKPKGRRAKGPKKQKPTTKKAPKKTVQTKDKTRVKVESLKKGKANCGKRRGVAKTEIHVNRV